MGGCVVGLIAVSLSWFAAGGEGYGQQSGWGYTAGWLSWLLLLGAAALVSLKYMQPTQQLSQRLPWPEAWVVTTLGGAAFLLVFIRVLMGQPVPPEYAGVTVSRQFGIYFFLLVTAVVTAAGFLKRRESPTPLELPHDVIKKAKVAFDAARAAVTTQASESGPQMRTPEAGVSQGHEASRFCTNCGAQFPSPDSQFCSACGSTRQPS